MQLDNLPTFVATRLLRLEQQNRDAQAAARDIADNLTHVRMILAAPSNPATVHKQAGEQLTKLTAELKQAEATSGHLSYVLDQVHDWIKRLPDDTILEKYVPRLPPEDAGAPQERLNAVRAKIKAADAERTRLENMPSPSADIRERIEQRVKELAGRPTVHGMGEGKRLTIAWPGSGMTSTGPDETSCSALQLFCTLFPQQMVELALSSVETTCGSPEAINARYERIDSLKVEVNELERRAGDLVRAIISRGGDQGFGSAPPAAILGVRIAQKEKAAA